MMESYIQTFHSAKRESGNCPLILFPRTLYSDS